MSDSISCEPARYAKGMILVRFPGHSGQFKSYAMTACERLNGRWTKRERGYILSPAKVDRLRMMMSCRESEHESYQPSLFEELQ